MERNGFGNPRIVGFSSNRESRTTLQDAIFDNRALAMLTGNDLIEGVRDVHKIDEVSVVSDKATLKSTPTGNLFGVFELNEDGTLGKEFTLSDGAPASGEYSINGKEITFFTGDLDDDDKVHVYYPVSTDSSAKEIKVTSDQFGKTFKVVIDTLVRDEFTQEDYAAQIIIPRAKFEDNFNINLAVDGDPAVLDLNMEILKDPTSTDMWKMIIYDEGAIA